MRRRQALWTSGALAAILLAAAYLRIVGLDWDEGFLLHPDERFLALVHASLGSVHSLHEYFDTAHSPLNPNNRGFPFYIYGLLPLFTVRGLAACLGAGGLAPVSLVGRGLSATADLASLLLLFAIGRRLYGRATGALAAALYGGAVLPIQLSHFSTMDVCANTFVVIAFWAAVRMREAPRWSDDLVLGVASALGAACKISVAAVFALGPLAIGLRLLRRRRDSTPAGRDDWIRAAAGVNVAVLAALLVFRVAQPYAFVPARPAGQSGVSAGATLGDVFLVRLNPDWRAQMSLLRQQIGGASDSPPLRQWANHAGLAHAWSQSIRFGLGWPLGIAAWLAWISAVAEMVRRRAGSERHVLPVLWIAFVFLWNGSQFAVTMRYFLPAYPFLALLAAHGLVVIATAGARAGGPRSMARCAGLALGALVVAGTYAWAFAFTRIYTRPHTRIAASRWIDEHVAPGAAIASEGRWDDDLPLPLPEHEAPDQVFRLLSLEMNGEDTPDKRAHMREVLDGADYVVISSNRFYASLSRLPSRWPMSIEYYRALFGGRLGFTLAGDFTSPPSLGPLAFDDQRAEESFTVYDHPRVFVFRKTSSYSAAATAAILEGVDLARVRRDRPAEVRDAPALIELPPPRYGPGKTRPLGVIGWPSRGAHP